MQIALFVSSSDALKSGWLLTYLRSVSAGDIRRLQQNLAKVCSSSKIKVPIGRVFLLSSYKHNNQVQSIYRYRTMQKN